MKIRRREGRDLARSATLDRDGEDARLAAVRRTLIADAEHGSIEGQYVIVVVLVGGVGGDGRGFAGGEVKTAERTPVADATAEAVDEGAAVAGPNWGPRRVGRRNKFSGAAVVDVEQFQNAADVIVIGNKIRGGGADEADIVESGVLGDIAIMGTDEGDGVNLRNRGRGSGSSALTKGSPERAAEKI